MPAGRRRRTNKAALAGRLAAVSRGRLVEMKRKGVSYDVGRVLGGNWRPVFDPEIARQELKIMEDDLHCTAVRICGPDSAARSADGGS